MLANNGLAGNPSFDRKGFEFGVAFADLVNKNITIAGPSDNKNWLNAHLHLFKNKNPNYYEIYNASEGFFAIQDMNNSDDLLLGDKNALMVASRILAYGPEYTCEVKWSWF